MAITNNLRHQFKHDPMATAPEDCQNIVDHFLATGRGGIIIRVHGGSDA